MSALRLHWGEEVYGNDQVVFCDRRVDCYACHFEYRGMLIVDKDRFASSASNAGEIGGFVLWVDEI